MASIPSQQEQDLMQLTLQVRNRKENDGKYAKFRGDNLIGNQIVPKVGLLGDLTAALRPSNWPALGKIVDGLFSGNLDGPSLAKVAGSLSDYSANRQGFIDAQVKSKYDKMLHPPLTYLGDAFQYRAADGKFNSVLHPHLGQAGAPYAKTVPSKTAPLGALPDPSDLFDKLMAREEGGRESKSGLSSMLVYHATIIIHDIFRTNDNDKNISDSSSYLDLSPLYGYTMEMQRSIRDDKYKLGLLKPDTFAEDRLLRQPPGVCIMLVMYNRYHNYAARQLYQINENNRFSVPKKFKSDTMLVALAKHKFETLPKGTQHKCDEYEEAWKCYIAVRPEGFVPPKPDQDIDPQFQEKYGKFMDSNEYQDLLRHTGVMDDTLAGAVTPAERQAFEAAYEAAWNKLDDDLFNTARLITCGIYIQISVHDYLRALMGFHQFDTNFTLDPRSDFDQKKTTRGTGNQVTVEFNLLYRFHCAISLKDELYADEIFNKMLNMDSVKDAPYPVVLQKLGQMRANSVDPLPPWIRTFGIPDGPAGKESDPKAPKPKSQEFKRNAVTGLFDDEQMMGTLTAAMDDPISNFGPRNTPKCLKAIEIMGILQARKWEVGTLNDFREFFGMPRHQTFEDVSKNVEIQNALRDLYENPDKIELYPGIFCESDEHMGLDPGPKEASSALWAAIFSDAITLVRSDRFYTVDWNTNSLTSWGMNEVTPDNNICKSSVFHRLLQRAFPGWFPYNTVRFFHPFYTGEQNAIYAKEQGYGPQFKETRDSKGVVSVPVPEKPKKPIVLSCYHDICDVLKDGGNKFSNPALWHLDNLPAKMAQVLSAKQKKVTFDSKDLDTYIDAAEPALRGYLDDQMRYIMRRESIAMTKSTFQIDATRDFAIPIVTRYVADFLGFGQKLRTVTNLKISYTENEIYQHITNCQIFLTYNADETKLLKRRNAFKSSLAFLTDLTEQGNIHEASRWFPKTPSNPMSQLGYYISKQVLAYEKDTGKAASILVLICLEFAYNSVAAFTSVLDDYMTELYKAADDMEKNYPLKQISAKGIAEKGGHASNGRASNGHASNGHTVNGHASNSHTAHGHTRESDRWEPKWIKIQRLAFSTIHDDQNKLERKVQKAARKTVKLPIVRKVIEGQRYSVGKGPNKHDIVLEKGQIVILDMQSAFIDAYRNKDKEEIEYMSCQLSLAEKFAAFQPTRFHSLALTAMVKFIAQMKNPRRGHDAQGRLKKIKLESSSEGYSSFMAGDRVDRIKKVVSHLDKGDPNKFIFTEKILKPETDTYLTPTWDEMVPFPMTWKIRFDGFGKSNYEALLPFGADEEHAHKNPYGKVVTVRLPDDCPPWYQPQGISHIGGTFAGVTCICAAAKIAPADNFNIGGSQEHQQHCPCLGTADHPVVVPLTQQLSTGCGIGDAGL